MISNDETTEHIPVLCKEAIYYLNCQAKEGVFVDATVGLGGHAKEILNATSKSSILIGLDLDAKCLEIASRRLSKFGKRVILHQGNYKDIDLILNNLGISKVQGMLFDVGVCSYHFKENQRGFSFKDAKDAPLDMRFDETSKRLKASDIINRYKEVDLERIFREFGEERWARRIARGIIRHRKKEKIMTVDKLVGCIYSSIPNLSTRFKIHPATRVFQALRIEVNSELENLKCVLSKITDYLDKGARVCVISFHSLEDRIVKHSFKELSRKEDDNSNPRLKIITKKPILVSDEERILNSRARSAKMRVAERC